MLSLPSFEFDDKILMQGAEISRKLDQLGKKVSSGCKEDPASIPHGGGRPLSRSQLEHLKRLHLEGKGPIAYHHRRAAFYTAEQMIELRHFLDKDRRPDAKKYVPQRKANEKLQVIAVVNFKGGSGKTTRQQLILGSTLP